MLNRCSTLNPKLLALNPHPSSLIPKPQTRNSQPSTLKHAPSSFNAQRSTLNPKPQSLQTATLNPKLQIFSHSTDEFLGRRVRRVKRRRGGGLIWVLGQV